MESIRNSLEPRAKEKLEEEHEDSKKEREAKNQVEESQLGELTIRRNQDY
jgi:hypothetical protein